MIIQPFFDKITSTISYIITDEKTKHCAILDSVLDYFPESGKTTTASADKLIAYVKEQGLTVEWILETHVHADHLSAAHYLKKEVGGKIGIGENILKVIPFWTEIFNTEEDTPKDGSQFDYLFKDQEKFNIGSLSVQVINTPGHTPVCVSYRIEDAIFVGDTIFMPYMGTSRADFPGGDANTLYNSIQKILNLPPETRIFTCHDYPPQDKDPAWMSTVAEQKKENILINDKVSEKEYVEKRTQKDKTLPFPRLLLAAIQVNLRAGSLGKAKKNGKKYLHIPLNSL